MTPPPRGSRRPNGAGATRELWFRRLAAAAIFGLGLGNGVVAAAKPATAKPATAKPATADHKVIQSKGIMGTRVTVTLWTNDDAKAAKAIEAVFDEIARIEALMTSWQETSDVEKLNKNAGGKPVSVDAEVIAVMEKALEVSQLSSGAFDITVGAYRGLWKFDHDLDGSLPSKTEIAKRLPLVGYKNIRLNKAKKTVQLRKKGMRITLGGIAKGYAVDRSVELLKKRGYANFMIQAGGDLYVSGRKGSKPWTVGIRDPRGAANQVFAAAQIENRTFSTSGDYERSFIKDGVRYHHILDPKTGKPAMLSRSVTVFAKDALTADAWSTALFVLGAEKGMKLVEKLDGIDAVFVDAKNTVRVSSGLKDKVNILREPTP